jgi:hypothetical protein
MLNLHSNIVEASADEIQEFKKQQEGVKPLELAPPIHIKFENCIAGHVAPEKNSGGAVWKCEFCAHVNAVDLEPEEVEEIKQNATLDFLVQIPEKMESDDNARIVCFCIDVSGSM